MIEDHLRILVQERKAVAPFVLLGVLDEGSGELRPAMPIEIVDLRFGDIPVGIGGVKAGGDGGMKDTPIRLLVLFAGGLEGGRQDLVHDNLIVRNGLRVELVIGLGMSDRESQEATQKDGNDFFP